MQKTAAFRILIGLLLLAACLLTFSCGQTPQDDASASVPESAGSAEPSAAEESVPEQDAAPAVKDLQGRIINVTWDDSKEGLEVEVDLRVLAEDRKGLLVDISRVTDEMGVSITALAAKSDRESAVANISMTVALTDTKQLDRIIARLKQIDSVADVYRAVV